MRGKFFVHLGLTGIASLIAAGQSLAQVANNGGSNSPAVDGYGRPIVTQDLQQPQQQGTAQPQQQQRPATPAGGSPVGMQVNNELYGNYTQRAPMYVPQVQPLPSETLMAIQRSGALPSEIQMNAQQIGPLSPHGAIDYVPDQSAVQRAMGAKPINLWGPAYGPSLPQTQNGPGTPSLQNGTLPGTAASAFGQTNPGSIDRTGTVPTNNNYVAPASPQFVNRQIQPQMISSGYQVQPMTTYRRPISEETTTTTILIHRIPTTQPTTRSLGSDDEIH